MKKKIANSKVHFFTYEIIVISFDCIYSKDPHDVMEHENCKSGFILYCVLNVYSSIITMHKLYINSTDIVDIYVTILDVNIALVYE